MLDIKVTLNGQTLRLSVPANLAQALAQLPDPQGPVATAVNGDFVARDARADHALHDGDAIFVFQAITGG